MGAFFTPFTHVTVLECGNTSWRPALPPSENRKAPFSSRKARRRTTLVDVLVLYDARCASPSQQPHSTCITIRASRRQILRTVLSLKSQLHSHDLRKPIRLGSRIQGGKCCKFGCASGTESPSMACLRSVASHCENEGSAGHEPEWEFVIGPKAIQADQAPREVLASASFPGLSAFESLRVAGATLSTIPKVSGHGPAEGSSRCSWLSRSRAPRARAAGGWPA